MAYQVTLENLIATGAHFGHLTRRWHPGFRPYVYMKKNGVHIIDLKQTIDCLERCQIALAETVRGGGSVLFIGTKKQARDVLQKEADRCGMFYVVERWLGGTLTNFVTIKRSIKRLQKLEKDADSIYQTLTKKEVLRLERERIRLADQHRGIKDMKQLPEAVFVVDARHEETAVREARRLEIPLFGIIDTNTDPSLIDFPIPANDDSLRTIQLLVGAVADNIIAARGGQSFDDGKEVLAEPTGEAVELDRESASAAREQAIPDGGAPVGTTEQPAEVSDSSGGKQALANEAEPGIDSAAADQPPEVGETAATA